MSEVMELGSFLVACAIAFFLIAFSYSMLRTIKREDARRKVDESYMYRKHLTNMLVAGKVRILAEEAGINVDNEAKDFKDYMRILEEEKKAKDLDDRIEDQIQTEVEESENKKESK